MNTKEYYLEAVSAWKQANKKLKHFAECCYHVSDRETQALAADCGCSVDTIENYRRAYVLYTELGRDASELVREAWDSASIALWVKAAQLRTRLELPLDKTFEYLSVAIDHNMTRESFAAHVDGKENNTPKWIRRLQQAIRLLAPSKDDYKSSDIPPLARERYDRAVETFVHELEEIANFAETL